MVSVSVGGVRERRRKGKEAVWFVLQLEVERDGNLCLLNVTLVDP